MKLPHSLNIRGFPLVASLLLNQRSEASGNEQTPSLGNANFPSTSYGQDGAEKALSFSVNSSFHVAGHKANMRLLRFGEEVLVSKGITRAHLEPLFSGAGVYIAPEDTGIRGAFGANPASHVGLIRDELLSLTRREFPRANRLYVVGPNYEFGYCETPSSACSERDFFFGLDKDWPQELIDQKLSWGICLGLWDSAYYMKENDSTATLARKYEEVAHALYRNMAEQAALLVSTLMWNSIDSHIFDRSFRKAGWEVIRLGSHGAEPLLIVKPEERSSSGEARSTRRAGQGTRPATTSD